MLFTFVIVFAFFTQRSSQGIPSISTSDLSETSIATEYRPPNSGKGCINGHTKLDEKDCTAYYECVNNCYELRLCAYGKFYDPEEGCCRADYVCPNRGITQTRSRPVKGAASECTNGDVRSDPRAQARVHSEDQGGLNGEHTGAEQARGPPGSAIGSYLGAENSYSTSSVSHADGSPFDTTVLRGGGGIYNTAQPSTMSRERNTVPEWINELCEESGGPSGYRADPHDCHRYFQCAQAHWVHKDCPSNLVWNPAKNVCDWPHAGLKC